MMRYINVSIKGDISQDSHVLRNFLYNTAGKRLTATKTRTETSITRICKNK